jgi:hypothetical protein
MSSLFIGDGVLAAPTDRDHMINYKGLGMEIGQAVVDLIATYSA